MLRVSRQLCLFRLHGFLALLLSRGFLRGFELYGQRALLTFQRAQFLVDRRFVGQQLLDLLLRRSGG